MYRKQRKNFSGGDRGEEWEGGPKHACPELWSTSFDFSTEALLVSMRYMSFVRYHCTLLLLISREYFKLSSCKLPLGKFVGTIVQDNDVMDGALPGAIS